MNGFPTVVNVLDSPHFSLQKGAAQVIGDICQNNETGQQNMLPLNVMQKLLKIIDSHSDPECMVKALYALSCKFLFLQQFRVKLTEALGYKF